MIITNALEKIKEIRRARRPHSEQAKTLLKLNINDGFVVSAKKVQNLRLLAGKNGMKIKAARTENGNFMICRIK